ncbi:protein terminus [Drosophila persimilis]|uniref:Protein terminus n=2 Tax=pseudoobscura subgroup TaxID=32358 RepID=A0A6I8UD37_DROPS|nr:protein terminus [Drosophila pseudoobscura]XP_002021308.2 protein terminus [Drosophila persimilis]
MLRRTYSRFIFETIGDSRIFHHQRFVNDLQIDCPTCTSCVETREPYSRHWQNDHAAGTSHQIKMGPDERLLLKRIETERIEAFMLCDGSVSGRTNDFLLEAGMEAVPQLLRFLSFGAAKLEVTIGFYVNVKKERMYYESSPMIVEHHLDIVESVDMLFSMLLEKISNYVLLQQRVPLEACVIRRMKVTVKRHSNPISVQWRSTAKLPLQYRVKRLDTGTDNATIFAEICQSPRDIFHIGLLPDALQVNLYCFRVCASTKELYAVPYLIRHDDVENTPTFVIHTDIAGHFRGLQEIRNVRKFLRADRQDRVFECRKCKSRFGDRVQFALHKQIDCGRGFMVWHLEEDAIELHHNCLPLPKGYFKHDWFGLGTNTTIK